EARSSSGLVLAPAPLSARVSQSTSKGPRPEPVRLVVPEPLKRSPVQTVLALLMTGFGMVPPEVHGRRALRLPAPGGAAVTLTDPCGPRAAGAVFQPSARVRPA